MLTNVPSNIGRNTIMLMTILIYNGWRSSWRRSRPPPPTLAPTLLPPPHRRHPSSLVSNAIFTLPSPCLSLQCNGTPLPPLNAPTTVAI